jgi:hypothetical protein
VPPAYDITTRVALLEQSFAYIEKKLEDLASSFRWVQRTMIGLLVAVAGGVALILLKG